jgi:hypothetical protein
MGRCGRVRCGRRVGGAGLVVLILCTAMPALAEAGKPLFFACKPNASGKYQTEGCNTVAPPADFERVPLVAGEVVTFSSSNANGEITIKTGAFSLKCSSFNMKGQTNGPNEINQTTINFKGCKETISGNECGTAFVGEFTTNALKGKLVYLDAAKTKPGILLAGENTTVWVESQCGGTPFRIIGEVLGEIGTINKSQSANTFVFAENGAGTEQKYTKIEEATALTTPLDVNGEAARVKATENLKWPCPNMGVEG